MLISSEQFRVNVAAAVRRSAERNAGNSNGDQTSIAKQSTAQQQQKRPEPRFVRAESFSGE